MRLGRDCYAVVDAPQEGCGIDGTFCGEGCGIDYSSATIQIFLVLVNGILSTYVLFFKTNLLCGFSKEFAAYFQQKDIAIMSGKVTLMSGTHNPDDANLCSS